MGKLWGSVMLAPQSRPVLEHFAYLYQGDRATQSFVNIARRPLEQSPFPIVVARKRDSAPAPQIMTNSRSPRG